VKEILFFLFFFILGFLTLGNLYFAMSTGIFGYYLRKLIIDSSSVFAFREWALFLYALNYLFSPAITYQFDQAMLAYPMKINAIEYYSIAIPGFFSLYSGMYILKTRIFVPRIDLLKEDAKNNKSLLFYFVFIGLIFKFIGPFFPGEFAFLIYLISSIRFVGAFALFTIDSKKYWKFVAMLLFIELYFAGIGGMYHDAVMWVLFFALYFVYTTKPPLSLRLIGLCVIIVLVLFIQGLKGVYRSKVNDTGESNIGLVLETSIEVSDDIGSDDNLLSSLNRGNQAWIFASTKERMDRIGDYQGLNILGIYLESALLPRIIAPDKIMSGDKKIFNEFSGHLINQGTSMGLGVFADGYIAYGFWGVMFFSLGLGFVFNLTFKVVESWANVSEFYVLMVLPLLNYAVRPDCELQTTLNHLTKGLFLFGILVTITKFNFVMIGRSSAKVNRSVMPLIE
jgi:hypothetical protein